MGGALLGALSSLQPHVLPPPPSPLVVEEGRAFTLAWVQVNLTLDAGLHTNLRLQDVNITLPPSVLTNETTLFAHIYYSRLPVGGDGPLEASPGDVLHVVYPLVKLLRRKPVRVSRSLLGGESDEDGKNESSSASSWGVGGKEEAVSATPTPAVRLLPYWKPTLHATLVDDTSLYATRGLPPHVSGAVHVELRTLQRTAAAAPVKRGAPASSASTVGYAPLPFCNDFWLLGSALLPLNESSSATVPLQLSFSPIALWKWALMTSMEGQWEMQAAIGGGDDSETDLLKGILLDTNPVLLGVTVLVSLLHMVFECVIRWGVVATKEPSASASLTHTFPHLTGSSRSVMTCRFGATPSPWWGCRSNPCRSTRSSKPSSSSTC